MPAPPTLQILSHIALFFLKDLHGTSATSMAFRIFLVLAFLLIVVSEDLLKMQRFKGTLDFSSLESHKVLTQEYMRNPCC